MIAVTSTPVSGALATAATQNSRLTGNASIASGTVTYNSVKIAPIASGQALTIAASASLSTSAYLLAGSTDYAINGGSLISSSAPRYFYVTDPNATLSVSSILASGLAITKAGDGFLALTGTTNQVAFTSSQNVNIGGGVLRVTSTNFVMNSTNPPILCFRGGVLEYDVSSAPFTFARNLGAAGGAVNWSLAANSNNLGSGGFSAFASNPANTLTVNLNNGAAFTWGGTTGASLNFVQDGNALLFGSTKSNATVIWQNPVNLDSGTAGPYLIREIGVTRGAGNAADLTRMTGVLAGTATTDVVKTGTGVLELAANSIYAGNTLINRGTLLVTGTIVPNTGSSNVFVHSTGTLGGTGTLGSGSNAVNVFNAGVLAPGITTGTLTVNGNLIFTSNGSYAAELGGTTANTFDKTVVNGGVTLNNSALSLSLVNGYTPANTDRLFIVVNDASDAVGGTFSGVVQDGTISFGGYTAQVSYTGDSGTSAFVGGNDIVLYNFAVSSVPELSTYAMIVVTLAGLGAAYGLRKRPAAIKLEEALPAAPLTP